MMAHLLKVWFLFQVPSIFLGKYPPPPPKEWSLTCTCRYSIPIYCFSCCFFFLPGNCRCCRNVVSYLLCWTVKGGPLWLTRFMIPIQLTPSEIEGFEGDWKLNMSYFRRKWYCWYVLWWFFRIRSPSFFKTMLLLLLWLQETDAPRLGSYPMVFMARPTFNGKRSDPTIRFQGRTVRFRVDFYGWRIFGI